MLKQILIASLLIAPFAGSAQAQEAPSVKVSVAGIDTRSESGARIVVKRIQAAAGAVCGPLPSDLMERQTHYAPCVRDVTERTVRGLNNPMLTAQLTGEKAAARPALLANAK